MSLIDRFIVLIAALIYFFAHTPLSWTFILTVGTLIVVSLLQGETISFKRGTPA